MQKKFKKILQSFIGKQIRRDEKVSNLDELRFLIEKCANKDRKQKLNFFSRNEQHDPLDFFHDTWSSCMGPTLKKLFSFQVNIFSTNFRKS